MPAAVTVVRDDLVRSAAAVVALLTSGAPASGTASAATASARGTNVEPVEVAFDVDLAAELERAEARGRAGEVVEVTLRRSGGPSTLLLAGSGDGSPVALRRAGAALARRCRGRAALAVGLPVDVGTEGTRALVEGVLLAAYTRPRRGSSAPKPAPLAALAVHPDPEPGSGPDPGSGSGSDLGEAVERAVRTATAAHTARDLANTSADIKTPQWLAGQARDLCTSGRVAVQVRDERMLLAEGFGGLLAVGSGSASPPRLIELAYAPAGDTRDSRDCRLRHIVLVGKGITFDSGGLSLKPAEAMIPMKTDMTGGGVVIAVLAALAGVDLPLRVTGLVAAAENLPGAAAFRPGDVITQYGGRTVEVLNTDAEGRLVLADALAYADAHLDPDILVDLATLTGAASIGLGRRHAALYTGDDDLAGQLLAAGEASGERLWRMPLVEDYREALDSDIADLCHISRAPHLGGGSITAALFLREFVGGRRWAHLDIAGPARCDADEHEVTKGGTGFGARILLRWLESLASA